MLTTDGYMLWWKDFNASVLVYILNTSTLSIYLEDTSLVVHMAL